MDISPTILGIVRRSPGYRTLHPRFASPKPPQPSEIWFESDRVYVVFDLELAEPGTQIMPMALFVVLQQPPQVLLVRIITPDSTGTETHIVDLYSSTQAPIS